MKSACLTILMHLLPQYAFTLQILHFHLKNHSYRMSCQCLYSMYEVTLLKDKLCYVIKRYN